MTAKIGIVGLGQIGGSVGLALKARAGMPELIGFDTDGRTARTAEAKGAVDSIGSLLGVARESAILFLCVPLSEMADVLRRIGPSLPEKTIVFETTPIKQPVMAWMREYLPSGRHYVGLAPSVSNMLLGASERGIDGARADLFRHTVMMIVTPPNTPAEVEQAAINVAGLLGAKPMLTDVVESDGIMTTAHLLPQLAASALVEASVSVAGWREARKLAGLPFAGVTGGAAYYDGSGSLEVAALGNSNAVVHGLDVLIAALHGLRDDIEKGDQANVSERLNHSFQAREAWLDERGSAAWLAEGGAPAELPGLGDQLMQMFFGSRLAERVKIKRQGQK